MKIKKIKKLTDEEKNQLFSNFKNSTTFLRTLEIPKLLSTSENLQNKTISVDTYSGAQIGMGFEIFRHDPKDKNQINVDEYFIRDNELLKVQPPFEGHHLPTLPSFTENMFVVCKSCNNVFRANVFLREIPLFNSVRRHSWCHVYCPKCNNRIDIARFDKSNSRFISLQG